MAVFCLPHLYPFVAFLFINSMYLLNLVMAQR